MCECWRIDLATGGLVVSDGLDLAIRAMVFGDPTIGILRVNTYQRLARDRDQLDETFVHPASSTLFSEINSLSSCSSTLRWAPQTWSWFFRYT